ncbi:MAG: hypothetical protein FWD38_01720 [Oscillospiraceae bacterium]|nr:hypothetical protein [Oscillospiraceae bacterium]
MTFQESVSKGKTPFGRCLSLIIILIIPLVLYPNLLPTKKILVMAASLKTSPMASLKTSL